MAEAGRICPSCNATVPGAVVTCPSCGALSLPPGPDLSASIAEQLGRHLGGRYRIERELGQGGMAIVYLAHDFKLKRSVAMKVMRPDIAAVLGGGRFLREIDIAAHLDHPGILALYDSGEAGGLLYYVMPYEEGQTLRARLESGPLPVAEAQRIGQELADALSYAHEKGVVHRDIKPENVLFLPHGHVAIADFGIARALAGIDAGITTTNVRVGSPQYMSPEQFIAGAEIGPRADVYALGCVVFEMLAGAAPYRAADFEALMSLHCTAPIPSARTARSDVPVAVDLAVRRALAKAPRDRYQSASDFGLALGAPRIEPAFVLREVIAATRRHLVGVAAAAALLAAAAVAATLLGRHPSGDRDGARLAVAVPSFGALRPALISEARSLADALGSDLARVTQLSVAYGPELQGASGTNPGELARRFGVRHVVVGRVLDSNPLRVTLRVVDADANAAIADTEVVAADPATAVTRLGTIVRRTIGRFRDSIESRARFRSDSAWRLFQLARRKQATVEGAYVIGAYRQGRQAMAEADSLAAVAASLEGGSPAGRTARADRLNHKAFIIEYVRQAQPDSSRLLPDPLALHLSALAPVDSILAADSMNAAALRFRSYLKLAVLRTDGADSMLASATRDAERATRLDPGSALGWIRLADCWSDSGAVDEELFALERAQELDAFAQHRRQVLRTVFDASLRAGQSWRAEPACRDAQREYPGEEQFVDCDLKLLAYTATTPAQGARALAIAESLLARSENVTSFGLWRLYAAQALARTGLAAQARRQLRLVEARMPAATAPVYILTETAATRLLLGDRSGAVALLRHVLATDAGIWRYLSTEQRFGALRESIAPTS